jgi:hypothetical protein
MISLEQTVVSPIRVLAECALTDGDGVKTDRSVEADREQAMHQLRGACVHAREAGLMAEDLIVILKDVWYALPDVRKLERTNSNNTLAHIVSACIEEFYATEVNRPIAPSGPPIPHEGQELPGR